MGFEGYLSRTMAEQDLKNRAKIAQIRQYLDAAPTLQTLDEQYQTLKNQRHLVGLKLTLEKAQNTSKADLSACDFIVLDVILSEDDVQLVREIKSKITTPLLLPIAGCDEYSVTQARVLGADGVILNQLNQSKEHVQMAIEVARDLRMDSILNCQSQKALDLASSHDCNWLLAPNVLVQDNLSLLSGRQVIVSDLIETQLIHLSKLKDKVLLGSMSPKSKY